MKTDSVYGSASSGSSYDSGTSCSNYTKSNYTRSSRHVKWLLTNPQKMRTECRVNSRRWSAFRKDIFSLRCLLNDLLYFVFEPPRLVRSLFPRQGLTLFKVVDENIVVRRQDELAPINTPPVVRKSTEQTRIQRRQSKVDASRLYNGLQRWTQQKTARNQLRWFLTRSTTPDTPTVRTVTSWGSILGMFRFICGKVRCQ